MKTIGIEELKHIQVDILKDVHAFCLKHGIQYSLAYGTLIGAVRHKGYIPWDDDIDIMMMRKDYDKFIELYRKENGIYKLYDYRFDKDYILPFAKVADTRTVLVEKSANIPLGINIDIFPLDDIADSMNDVKRIVDSQHLIKLLIRMKYVRPTKKNLWWKRVVLYVGNMLILPLSFSILYRSLFKKIAAIGSGEKKYVGLLCDLTPYPTIFERKYFNHFIDVPFEETIFKSIADYDGFLTNEYGDYMQLPPECDRQSPHTLVDVYWK